MENGITARFTDVDIVAIRSTYQLFVEQRTYMPLNIRAGKYVQWRLAEMYGVSQATISKIVSFKIYQKVDGMPHPEWIWEKPRIGQTFGRLTVVDRVIRVKKRGRKVSYKYLCKCRCECGKELMVHVNSLWHGTTSSCGCYRVDAHLRHGLCRHPWYRVYMNMIYRCYNESCSCYNRYGGSGIEVCKRWLGPNGLYRFFMDMSRKHWKPGLELGREDTAGHYKPSNCWWVTRKMNHSDLRNSNRWQRFKSKWKVTEKAVADSLERLRFGVDSKHLLEV